MCTTCVPATLWDKERVLDALGLELQTVVSHHVGMLVIEPCLSAEITSSLNYRANSQPLFMDNFIREINDYQS